MRLVYMVTCKKYSTNKIGQLEGNVAISHKMFPTLFTAVSDVFYEEAALKNELKMKYEDNQELENISPEEFTLRCEINKRCGPNTELDENNTVYYTNIHDVERNTFNYYEFENESINYYEWDIHELPIFTRDFWKKNNRMLIENPNAVCLDEANKNFREYQTIRLNIIRGLLANGKTPKSIWGNSSFTEKEIESAKNCEAAKSKIIYRVVAIKDGEKK